MTLIPDASSVYQESLPVSSDDLIKLLDQWGIIYNRTNHAPLKTVEESKKIQHQFLSSDEGEVILKISTLGTIKNAIF